MNDDEKQLTVQPTNENWRILIVLVAVTLIVMTYMTEKPGAIEQQDRRRLRKLLAIVAVFLAILVYQTYNKGFPQ